MEPDPHLYLPLANIILKSVTSGFIFSLLGIIILLFSSALVSGSEVAFFSLAPAQLEKLKNKPSKKNDLILSLLKKPERLLATILIANNFINIGIIILSAYSINSIVDFSEDPVWGFIFQVVVITFILLLFGEIIPKVYASYAGITFAGFTVYPLLISDKIFSPISYLLMKSSSVVDKRISRKQQNISVEELSQALELTQKDIKEDKNILKGIVNFGNIDVKEIMKPRVDVVAADIKFGFKKMLSIIIESGFSRIPIYEDTLDNIKGVLYIKDLLPHLEKENKFQWKDLIRDAYFVPENMKIDNLLEEFRQKKIHLSIVTDEYGGVLGIATLEDVLEEIVGEISDESDEEEDLYNKIDDKTFIFDGKIQLNDFFKITLIKDDVFDEVRGSADSLAGLILEIQKEIPEKGDVIKYNNYTFVIDSADNRKIKKIKFTNQDANP